MSNEDRRGTQSGQSSAPPEPAQFETHWDDETAPGLVLDEPLNELDRVTTIPELPPDLYVKKLMETADDSLVPEAASTPPVSLLPHDYFSLDSPVPPGPSSAANTLPPPRPPPSQPWLQTAPTARPNAATVPAPSPTLTLRVPAALDMADSDSFGRLKAALASHASTLDLAPELEFEDTEPSEPIKPVAPAEDMKDRYAMGDFSGALLVAVSILTSLPNDLEAARYAQSCRDVLIQMYSARLGSLDQIVTVAVPSDQIRWLTLDHRAGFLLSLVDGGSTVDQILDISGMARLDALRIMYQLVHQRVISLGS